MVDYLDELKREAHVGIARREARHATSWACLIELPSGRQLPCILKDVSKSGAKLGLPATFPLSKSFLVFIDDRNLMLDVSLVWRQGTFAGVKIEGVKRIPGRSKWVPELNEDEAAN